MSLRNDKVRSSGSTRFIGLVVEGTSQRQEALPVGNIVRSPPPRRRGAGSGSDRGRLCRCATINSLWLRATLSAPTNTPESPGVGGRASPKRPFPRTAPTPRPLCPAGPLSSAFVHAASSSGEKLPIPAWSSAPVFPGLPVVCSRLSSHHAPRCQRATCSVAPCRSS